MPFFELRGFASFCPNLLYLPQVATKKPTPTQLQTREENAHASKHQTENHLSGEREQNQQQNLAQQESRSHQPPRVTKCLRRGTGLFIFFCLPLPVPPLLQTFPLVVHFCQTASATVWTTAGTVRPEVGIKARQTRRI